MKPYIFGDRNGVHIIDLSQTVPLFARALDFVRQTVGRRRQGAVRRHQAPGAGPDRRGRAPLRASISSTTAGWAACSPTGRRSRSSIKRLKTLEEQLSGDTARPHQEGSAPADPRARQARALARRHPRHGRHSGRDVRDRREQGRAGDQGSQRRSASRSSRSSTPTSIRAASPSRFRATTTPAAPSASTATRSPRRRPRGKPGRRRPIAASTSARMDAPPAEEPGARDRRLRRPSRRPRQCAGRSAGPG